mgnify:CR=1 FL=1
MKGVNLASCSVPGGALSISTKPCILFCARRSFVHFHSFLEDGFLLGPDLCNVFVSFTRSVFIFSLYHGLQFRVNLAYVPQAYRETGSV